MGCFFLEEDMEEVILFVLSYLFVFAIYKFFIIRKAKSKKRKKNKEPIEVSYLVGRYKLDLSKVDYDKLLLVIAFVSSFDIALTVSIMQLFKSFLWQAIVGIILVIITILVSYHIVYLFYKKGGMIKDES